MGGTKTILVVSLQTLFMMVQTKFYNYFQTAKQANLKKKEALVEFGAKEMDTASLWVRLTAMMALPLGSFTVLKHLRQKETKA